MTTGTSQWLRNYWVPSSNGSLVLFYIPVLFYSTTACLISQSRASQSVQWTSEPLHLSFLQDALFNLKLLLNAKQTSRCSPESEILIVAVCVYPPRMDQTLWELLNINTSASGYMRNVHLNTMLTILSVEFVETSHRDRTSQEDWWGKWPKRKLLHKVKVYPEIQ